MPLYYTPTRPRYVPVPICGPPRRRYNGPLAYILDRGCDHGLNYNYAGNAGFYGGFGKHPKDWTTGDFEHLGEVMSEYGARERGRGRVGYRGVEGYGYGYGDGDGGGSRGAPDMRDLLAFQGRRLGGMEDALYGTETERNREAMRRHLRGVLGNVAGGRDCGYGDRHGRGCGGGGGYGGGPGSGLAQQRDLDRVDRNQRDLERDNGRMRRDLDRMRDRQRDRGRERSPWW